MEQQEMQTSKWEQSNHFIEKGHGSSLNNNNSWLYNWETRSKTLTAIGYIFFVLTLQSIPLLALAFSFVLITAVIGRLNLVFFARRLSWILPFLIFMAIPLLFGNGLSPTEQQITFTLVLFLKALTSVSVMIIMITTQPVERFFQGLANIGLPSYLVSILFLAFRYIFMFRDSVFEIERALKSRNFSFKGNKRVLPTMGEVIGGMFITAFDRSESVYQAMVSRGYDGTMRLGKAEKIYPKDWIVTVSVLGVGLLLMLIDRGVLFFG
ncbi:cobalt ECF transporter T component CbiQ [Desulfuribacillus alkaliarsenatis]|uniref:Cobalt ECF transporter T component CbiQ n=1 Tax=Desulfuribacillus alkaliarsenatis TaxID=766136 RepID=A0A1E5G3T9_9FIRM|nr:cobalt ECF transporter T component CbiQ [Desulfuribacillus alkaliarsenatis]OEF97744.1 cobalt ECF transporter T component CbiQ [Desulfuribacillus alkaliarsenatis]